MQFIRRLFGPSSKVSDPVSVTKVSYLSDSQTNAVVIESNVTSSSLSGTTLTPASVTIEEAVNTEKFFSEITLKDLSPTSVVNVVDCSNAGTDKGGSGSTNEIRSPEPIFDMKKASRTSKKPEFFGIGRMHRPNWVPKSQNLIKKIKYYGLNEDGYHMFKVWYVGLLEFEWEFRDYEELVESFPHLLPSCLTEIREGFRQVIGPVSTGGAVQDERRESVDVDILRDCSYVESQIPFQSKTKRCVQYSFLNLYGMTKVEHDHLQQGVPNDFTNFKGLESFLKTEGISFQRIRPGHGTDKANWLLTSATRGKYLVTGNGHAIGVVVEDNLEATIFDSAEKQSKRLNKRSLEYSIGSKVDDIRLIVDRRSKKAKWYNSLNTVVENMP